MIDAIEPCTPGILLVELPPRVLATSDGFAVYEHINDANPMHPKYGTVLAVGNDETEIRVADTIFFSYLVLESARPCAHEGILIKRNDRWFVLMRKSDVFLIVRGEEKIPINGFSLVAPVENIKTSVEGFNLSQMDSRRISAEEGTIRLIGNNPNGIKSGDHVMFEENSNAPVEYSLSATMETLYKIQEHEIVGILKSKINNGN